MWWSTLKTEITSICLYTPFPRKVIPQPYKRRKSSRGDFLCTSDTHLLYSMVEMTWRVPSSPAQWDIGSLGIFHGSTCIIWPVHWTQQPQVHYKKWSFFFFFQWNILTSIGLTNWHVTCQCTDTHTCLSKLLESPSGDPDGGCEEQQGSSVPGKQGWNQRGKEQQNELGTDWWHIFSGTSQLWPTGELSRGHGCLWGP